MICPTVQCGKAAREAIDMMSIVSVIGNKPKRSTKPSFRIELVGPEAGAKGDGVFRKACSTVPKSQNQFLPSGS